MRSAYLSVILLGLLGSSAQAHIRLLTPTPRYADADDRDNKACPCGVGDSGNNRTCAVPGDRSDPDRAVPSRVTTFAPGSTVTLRFQEYVPHAGRYRVAIDFDGADMVDFNQNILIDIPDPTGNIGNSGNGDIWEIDVTLPMQECENCSLQLIQMMDGNTADPVPDPIGRSTYYTCADIRISNDAPPPEPDAGITPPPGPDSGPAGTETDAGDTSPTSPKPASGGCQTGTGSAPWSFLAVFGALFFVGNRKRRRS